MATIPFHPPSQQQQQTNSIRPTPERKSTTGAPTAPKLRDSCNTCAVSKVKCGKEKPACSRCVKRGLTCEYFLTKRAGRSSNNSAANARRRSNSQISSQLSTTSSLVKPSNNYMTRDNSTIGHSSSASSDAGLWIAPGGLPLSTPEHEMPDYLDALATFLTPNDPASASGMKPMNTDLDDFFASLTTGNSGLEDLSNQPFNGALDFEDTTFSTPDNNIFSMSGDAVSDFLDLSEVQSPPITHQKTYQPREMSEIPLPNGSCCCLFDTLGYLKQLFPTANNCNRTAQGSGMDDLNGRFPTIQAVVAENQQIVEIIGNQLQCPCSQDGYILSIMALVVFKALDWYIAAARDILVIDTPQGGAVHDVHSPTTCHPEHVMKFPAVAGDYSIDGEDSGRVAAQLVLSELHRVQRLVNRLSQRFKGHSLRSDSIDSSISSSLSSSSEDGSMMKRRVSNHTSPFSQSRLDQLESDLRERLSAVSLEIVDMLRRA